MKRLELTAALHTGLHDIDEQHRQLFAWGNAVLDQSESSAVAAPPLTALQFLNGYVRYHFAAEEHMMARHGYFRAERHAALHDKIRNEVGSIYLAASTRGLDRELRARLSVLLSEWLVYHIGEADAAMAEFVREEAGRGPVKLPDVKTLRKSGVAVDGLSEETVRVVRPDGVLSAAETRARNRLK